MTMTFTEWRRENSGTKADYENYLAGLAQAGLNEQQHLAAAEAALARAEEHDPGSANSLGLGVLAIAHVLTALLRDTLQPVPVPRPYTPEIPVWNVTVRVRETVPADSAGDAITALAGKLARAGFDPIDGPGESYFSAQQAGDGTWATVVSVVACLRADTGAAARYQLTGELSVAGFLYDSRVQRGDWLLSEDQPA